MIQPLHKRFFTLSFCLFGFVAFASTNLTPQQNRQVIFSNQQPVSLRWKAFMSAVEKGGPEAEHLLQEASQSQDWVLRSAALVGVQSMDPKVAYDVGRKLLRDRALVVRSEAVRVLSQFRDPLLRKEFWRELHDKRNFHKGQSLWVRKQIVGVLADHPEKEEKQEFLMALLDQDPKVAEYSQQALEKMFGVQLGGEEKNFKEQHRLWSEWTQNHKF